MTTAVLSAITGNKVCGNLAMTGEVTIRGDVLMIGGFKKKSFSQQNGLELQKYLFQNQMKKMSKSLKRKLSKDLRSFM